MFCSGSLGQIDITDEVAGVRLRVTLDGLCRVLYDKDTKNYPLPEAPRVDGLYMERLSNPIFSSNTVLYRMCRKMFSSAGSL